MTADASPRREPGAEEILAARRLSAALRLSGGEPPSAERAASRRLAAALRVVSERLVEGRATLDEMLEAAEAAEQMAGALGAGERRRYGSPAAESGPTGDGFLEWSPQFGRSNPLAPPLLMHVDVSSATVRGEAVFGAAFEGPPGCLHGGAIAAAFDEVLGMTQLLTGSAAMTGTLSVRYRRPTPLHRPLRFEGWLVRSEGRKIVAAGRCLHGSEVTAEAEGLFVVVGSERFAQLDAERVEPVHGD